MSKPHLSCNYAAVLSTTDSTFLCAQGSRVKDVLHGHKGLMSNPGTLAYKTIQNHTKPLWSLALSQTSVGNMLLSLDCLLADGMSFHLFF